MKQEKTYWELRDRVVNELDTENTMRLVLDLLGNLKDLEEEVEKTKLYDGFKFDLNEITRDWN